MLIFSMFASSIMQVLRSLYEITNYVSEMKHEGKTIGFVPTMGFLHEGHMSLVKLSKKQTDVTIASIYVNPSQFNDISDFENYPKDEEADLSLLALNECDAVFIPSQDEIESLNKVQVNLDGLDEVMEGKHRPGHFKGVVEVVYRLFSAVTPDKAFFGEKDYQQLLVIRKMVDEVGLNVDIVGAPIIREKNGLAMSSRNVRLSKEGRERAKVIFETLSGYNDLNRSESERNLAAAGFELEYLEEFEYNSIKRLFIAGFLEGVRLIDNVSIN